MESFKQYLDHLEHLDESINSTPASYRTIASTPESKTYKFKIVTYSDPDQTNPHRLFNEYTYGVSIDLIGKRSESNKKGILHAKIDETEHKIGRPIKGVIYQVEFWLETGRGLAAVNRFDETGTGSVGKVLSTVRAIIKEFISKHKEEIGAFIIEAASKRKGKVPRARARIYQRLIKRELSKMPGWKLKSEIASFILYKT